MKKTIAAITAGLTASCLLATGARGEALLGHPYFEIAGGWEYLKRSSSENGLAVAAEWNMPIMIPEMTSDFGMDFLLRGELADLSDLTTREVEAIARGYMRQEGGFLPFGGIGVGVVDFDGPDSGYLPIEFGVEFGPENVAIRPFARYAFTFDNAIGDFWTVGAKGVVWFHPDTWGVTGLIEYTDFHDGAGSRDPESGLALRVGLVFDY